MVHNAICTDADLLELARRHKALLDAANAASWPDAAAEEFLSRLRELESAITESPAVDIAGALAKARIVGYLLMQNGASDEADLAVSLVMDLERLAGGA